MSLREIREVEILKTPLYIRLHLGPLLSFVKISAPPNGVLGNGALPYLYTKYNESSGEPRPGRHRGRVPMACLASFAQRLIGGGSR